MGSPKLYFDSAEEMRECAMAWQRRLCLNDWIIRVDFASTSEMKLEGSAGECEPDFVNRWATIRILRKEDLKDPSVYIAIQPMELVLIHELLHCRFMQFEDEERSIEMMTYSTAAHQLLNDVTRALYMAKYGLDAGWFIVDGGCKDEAV